MSLGAKNVTIQMLAISILFGISSVGICFGAELSSNEESILEWSMEDLLNIGVTSVSKRPQSL